MERKPEGREEREILKWWEHGRTWLEDLLGFCAWVLVGRIGEMCVRNSIGFVPTMECSREVSH